MPISQNMMVSTNQQNIINLTTKLKQLTNILDQKVSPSSRNSARSLILNYFPAYFSCASLFVFSLSSFLVSMNVRISNFSFNTRLTDVKFIVKTFNGVNIFRFVHRHEICVAGYCCDERELVFRKK